jgi:hypothetical protein
MPKEEEIIMARFTVLLRISPAVSLFTGFSYREILLFYIMIWIIVYLLQEKLEGFFHMHTS